jgi:hypothetical protein
MTPTAEFLLAVRQVVREELAAHDTLFADAQRRLLEQASELAGLRPMQKRNARLIRQRGELRAVLHSLLAALQSCPDYTSDEPSSSVAEDLARRALRRAVEEATALDKGCEVKR